MARVGLGIDWAGTGVKAVAVRRKGGGFAVTGAARVPLEPDKENPADGMARAARILGKSLTDAGLAKAGAVLGATGRDVNLRMLFLPRTTNTDFDEMLGFELQELTEKAGGEVNAGGRPVKVDAGADELPVLVGLAKGVLIDERRKWAGLATLQVLDVWPNSLGLYEAYRASSWAARNETVLIVDLGQDNLDTVVADGEDLVFARNISTGAKVFVETVQGVLKCSRSQAEAALAGGDFLSSGTGKRTETTEAVRMALLNAAGQIQNVIQSSINFVKMQTKRTDLAIQRVGISGGGARLGGLVEFLQRGLGMPVEIFNPFRDLDLGGLPPDMARGLTTGANEYAVPLGLAIGSQADIGQERVSLMASSQTKRRGIPRADWSAIAAAVLVVAGLAVLGVSADRNAGAAHRQLEAARQEQTRINGKEDEYAEALGERDGLHQSLAAAARDADDGRFVVEVLRKAALARPDNLWFTSVTLTAETPEDEKSAPVSALLVKGFMSESSQEANQALERFVNELAGADGVGEVRVQSLAPESGRSVFALSIRRRAEGALP